MSNPLLELEKCGQSVWLDNINREILQNGKLGDLIKTHGVRGVTSNPAIFQKAMASGSFYDRQIVECLTANPVLTTAELYEELAVKDIQDTADALFSIYKNTNGADGFVSLEVSPELAYDTGKTIEAARRLFKKVARPNLMIKIPATAEGIPAIRQMISEGVNINITLIFSGRVYEDVVEAYISGLEERLKSGEDISNVASVASFFISRIDSLVDKELAKKGNKSLSGKIAIANAKVVYQNAKKLFGNERFQQLKKKGASAQRLLWASTGTKNPAYPDTIYVDELIGKNTVNTMPPATMEAFKDHGRARLQIEEAVDKAEISLKELTKQGIDLEKVTDQLTKEGVQLFIDAYNELISGLREKRDALVREIPGFKSFLPDNINDKAHSRLDKWESENFSIRLWEKDFSLWKKDKKDDVELSNRLGWLKLPETMKEYVKSLTSFADEIKKEFETVFVLGMGGSSLAPEVFFNVFGRKQGYPELVVVDNTHPETIRRILNTYNLKKSLFIAASKSGSTIETTSFYRIFYEKAASLKSDPGNNFIAITDAGSSLEKLAAEKGFRKTFLTPEEVGGRYSAFTWFGLVPAALIGVDLQLLLNKGEEMMHKCGALKPVTQNPGLITGAIIGELAQSGIDKLTFLTSPCLSGFPVWVEQLIAESTGKQGKGILPVAGELPGKNNSYSGDRAFVYFKLKDDKSNDTDELIDKLISSGYPVLVIELEDTYDLGKEFYRWEVATAAAGAVLQINPFDQPNVQLAKTLAGNAMKAFSQTGKLPAEKILFEKDSISVSGEFKAKDTKSVLEELFSGVQKDSYAALIAFVPPDENTNKALQQLRSVITNKYSIAVTAGYGPRFLHSTGQLHKGDGGKGIFIQFTSEIKNDLPVPGTDYTLGTLITAQAQGDFQALKNSGRKILSVNIKGDIADSIKKLAQLF